MPIMFFTVAAMTKNADLDGWVTVINNAAPLFVTPASNSSPGTNRVADRGGHERSEMNAPMPWPKAAQQSTEAFSEYHLYPRPQTPVKTRKPSRSACSRARRSRRENLHGQRTKLLLPQSQAPGAPLKIVMVYYKLQNEEKPDLGIPLPAQRPRVSKDSKAASLRP